jgi:hypothetical protein
VLFIGGVICENDASFEMSVKGRGHVFARGFLHESDGMRLSSSGEWSLETYHVQFELL